MSVLAIIAVMVLLPSAPMADKVHTLKYDLPIGMSYEYRIQTDQIPFPSKVVRLHTLLTLDVVGRDEFDQTICRFSIASDTAFQYQDNIQTRPYGSVDFAGHKLYSKAGYLELVLDAHGNLSHGDSGDSSASGVNEVSTQFRKITSESMMAAVSGNSPYMLQLLMPSIPKAQDLEIEREYVDTITFPSRSVYVPTNYGTSNTVEHKVLYDTLYRVSILDSVKSVGRESLGYMTLRNERRNALGAAYYSESQMVRDMRTGLIRYVSEVCYKYTSSGRKMTYRSSAELINTAPMASIELRPSEVKHGSR